MHTPGLRRLPCRRNGPPYTIKALETIRPQVDRGEPLRQAGVKTVRSRILVGVRPVRGRYGGSAGSVARLPPPPVRIRQVHMDMLAKDSERQSAGRLARAGIPALHRTRHAITSTHWDVVALCKAPARDSGGGAWGYMQATEEPTRPPGPPPVLGKVGPASGHASPDHSHCCNPPPPDCATLPWLRRHIACSTLPAVPRF